MERSMMEVFALIVLATAFIFVDASGTFAGIKKRFEKTYNRSAYTKKRFKTSDTNSNEYVTRGEAGGAARPVEKKLGGGRRFDAADTDDDDQLTLDEARERKEKEKGWWKSRF